MAARRDKLAGVVVLDKPAGITSFDAVKRVRRLLAVNKAGHTGTLDPMATGVLPICLGEATKVVELLLSSDKAYAGTGRLGIETDTLDITGTVTREADQTSISAISQQQLVDAIAPLTGRIMQTPPAFSAIRQDGKRAHELARRGEAVQLRAREVVVSRYELQSFRTPDFDFLVECSKGTYVRSLVADLGAALGCGATLAALRRLQSGCFHIDQAVTLEQLESPDAPTTHVIALDDALAAAGLGVADVSAEQAAKLRNGQWVRLPGAPEGAGLLLRVRCDGCLVALVERRADGNVWPKRVFHLSA